MDAATVAPTVATDAAVTVGLMYTFGLFITLLYYLAPFTTYQAIWTEEAIDYFSSVPCLTSLLHCVIGTAYGLRFDDASWIAVGMNTAGIVIVLGQVGIFIKYSQNDRRSKIWTGIIGIAFLAVVLFAILYGGSTTDEGNKVALRILWALSLTMMYWSPVAIMRRAIQARTAKYMSRLMVYSSVVNSLYWMSYYIARSDTLFAIMHGVGVLPSVAQVAFYHTYSRVPQVVPQEVELEPM